MSAHVLLNFFLPTITVFSPSPDIQGVGEGHPPACLINYKYGIIKFIKRVDGRR